MKNSKVFLVGAGSGLVVTVGMLAYYFYYQDHIPDGIWAVIIIHVLLLLGQIILLFDRDNVTPVVLHQQIDPEKEYKNLIKSIGQSVAEAASELKTAAAKAEVEKRKYYFLERASNNALKYFAYRYAYARLNFRQNPKKVSSSLQDDLNLITILEYDPEGQAVQISNKLNELETNYNRL